MSVHQPGKPSEQPVKKGPRCPICRDAVVTQYRPFCSKRCADIDLGRWLNGNYAIAGHHDDEEDGLPGPKTDYDPDE